MSKTAHCDEQPVISEAVCTPKNTGDMDVVECIGIRKDVIYLMSLLGSHVLPCCLELVLHSEQCSSYCQFQLCTHFQQQHTICCAVFATTQVECV